jgi:GMP synthase-like glutamine amidotransferase
MRNHVREIGWHPVRLSPEAAACPLLEGWPAQFTPLSWHGDMFAIPPGARHLATSEACVSQAFAYGDRVVGLQFHVEYQADSIRAMIAECADELADGGPYVQSPEAILAGLPNLDQAHALLERMMGVFERMLG